MDGWINGNRGNKVVFLYINLCLCLGLVEKHKALAEGAVQLIF